MMGAKSNALFAMALAAAAALAPAVPYSDAARGAPEICGLEFCSDYPGGKGAYVQDWLYAFLGQQTAETHARTPGQQGGLAGSHGEAASELPARLDEHIHRFELGEMTAHDAIREIEAIYHSYVESGVTDGLVERIGDRLGLYHEGVLGEEDAIESIHLAAEPQNIDYEFAAAVSGYLTQHDRNELTAGQAARGIIEEHARMESLYATSKLVGAVGDYLAILDSEGVANVLGLIRAELQGDTPQWDSSQKDAPGADGTVAHAAGDHIPEELPPDTVDIPSGASLPTCADTDSCYSPSALFVATGTAITWVNSDGLIPHTVTAGWPGSESAGLDYPGGEGFDSDIMAGGDVFRHTFGVPGEYDYFCTLHPWMVGSVTVEDAVRDG